MTATRAREQGYLVIADISGYTSFLARTELEHAHGIVAELTELVIARLGDPLRFVELEGDAVFAYAPAAAFADAERLLDMIEGCYVAFQLRLEEMRRATTCTCSACALMGALDLKFVAHLGSFILQQTPNGLKPLGPDVILVHRLLKNGVGTAFGTRRARDRGEAERRPGRCGLGEPLRPRRLHLVHRAVDWRPFDYLTLETTPITRGPLTLPRSLSTFEFTEDGSGRSVVAMNVRALDRGLLSRITDPAGRPGHPAPVPGALHGAVPRPRGRPEGVVRALRPRSG